MVGSEAVVASRRPPQLVPVFIPTFNNPTFLRSMVAQLQQRSLTNITVLDNASTYPPMLELLDELSGSVSVRRLAANVGPRGAFQVPELWDTMPPIFCLTDPDLRFNPAMPDLFVERLLEVSERYSCGKVGLALDISDPRALRDDDFKINDAWYKVWEWEAQFWKTEVEPQVFEAPVDTTFALYNKAHFDLAEPLRALRVAGNFTCEHLPWRKDLVIPTDELDFYRATNRHSYYLPNVNTGSPS